MKDGNGHWRMLGDAHKFNPKSGEWKKIHDILPSGDGQPRCVMAGTVAPIGANQLLVFGGANGKRFITLTGLAEQIAAAEAAGNTAAAATLKAEQQKIQDTHIGFSRDVLLYNTVTDRWTWFADFTQDSRSATAPGATERVATGSHVTTTAVSWGGSIVIPSGESIPGIRTPNIWKIDLAKPEQSLLLAMISWKDEDHEMLPKKKLSDEQIALLIGWVKLGAPFNPASEIHGKELAHGDLPTNEINERTTSAWAFKAVKATPAPEVDDATWQKNGIDAFVYDRLHKAGLRPSAPAAKRVLIRRACYDLTGLPPSPPEVEAFLADSSPGAFGKVIDRLLASDRYGEKWGRHWLDLVRFAETNGYERDSRKDLIWKYRDYVIRAFNQDKPYDRFIMEQLAGDELPDRDADSITATGFYRLGIWDDEPADRELARYNYLDDILRTTAETFLGLTIGCARCHDHKIDPISAKDYYSMLSFFSDISPHGKGNRNHVSIGDPADKAAHDKAVAKKQASEAGLQAKLAPLEEEFIAGLAKRRPELKLGTGLAKGKKDAWVVPDANRGRGVVWEFTYDKPADNWFEIAFDDSKWRKGRSGFGSPGTPGSKVRTPWHSSDIWLRRDFRFDTIPGKLTLKIHHDEDAEVYLNRSEERRVGKECRSRWSPYR